MWEAAKEGQGVLIETPSRWYLGVVTRRSSVTLTLGKDGLVAHYISDLGEFLEGKIPAETELTPLPREIEISLGAVESVQPYPVNLLRQVRRRTHAKVAETESA